MGCMGGIGRTGLMLSLLAKAFGVEDPVAYVRKHYYSHAVETKEQRQFIADFAIPLSVRWATARATATAVSERSEFFV